MSRSTRITAVAGAGALVASLGLPGLALAAESTPATARVTASADRADVDTTVFAGYVAALGGKKTVDGTFTVPELDCGGSDEGIDTLVELASDAGAFYIDGAVFSSCVGGEASHNAVFDTNTATGGAVQVPIEENVADGDKIEVSSKVKDDGSVKVTVTNKTKDWEVSDSFEGLVPDEASILQYSITSGGVPLEPLQSTVKVTGAKVGGDKLKSADPTKYVLVDDSGDTLIKPTKIKKGTKFSFK